jgi:hypothetical protein
MWGRSFGVVLAMAMPLDLAQTPPPGAPLPSGVPYPKDPSGAAAEFPNICLSPWKSLSPVSLQHVT